MSFLHRQRSFQPFAKQDKDKSSPSKSLPLAPTSLAPVENVPKKQRKRTTSMAPGQIMRRVSSMFSPKRKAAPPSLKLADVPTSVKNVSAIRSSNSFESQNESEDDIRRPSGLGRPVSVMSNRSLPPSPFTPSSAQREGHAMGPDGLGDYQRTRAFSSPNLLRSLSLKVRGKTARQRKGSVSQPRKSGDPVPASVPPPHSLLGPGASPVNGQAPPAKPSFRLPPELLILILSHLPRSSIASAALTSQHFASAARTSLYSNIDLDQIAPAQLEQLVAILVSRVTLTDLVTGFSCPRWPAFFIPDSQAKSAETNGRVIQHKDALLTATFTLALERMSNLTDLTLPCFDQTLLAHHSAFGLKSLTFLNQTMSDAEVKSLFTWLDGQINITSLRFPNLEDVPNTLSINTNIPYRSNSRPGTAPANPYLLADSAAPASSLAPNGSPLPSPSSGYFSLTPPHSASDSPFASPSLLPTLRTLHASPVVTTLLLSPPHQSPSHNDIPLPPLPRRPLEKVTLNINTTLYSGLRPASLMSLLHGISQLSICFSGNVDKRTFEKVLGAAGASLGSPSGTSQERGAASESASRGRKSRAPDSSPPPPRVGGGGGDATTTTDGDRSKASQWPGVQTLNVVFHSPAQLQSGREEAIYKSTQASLPRHKALVDLKFDFISSSETRQQSSPSPKAGRGSPPPTPPEASMMDAWVKICPTLESITLFSGATWRK